MVRRFSRNKAISEINVVPYIDVMLVLLVIFMITAPLLTQGVEIELPRAQAEIISGDKREPLIVSVDVQGEYFLNVNAQPEATVAPNTLATRIAAELQLAEQRGEQRVVLVRGDEGVDYGKVVTLMVLLQQVGVENIGLITQSEEADKDLMGSLLPIIDGAS